MKVTKPISWLLALCVALVGCQTITDNPELSKLVVQVATIKVVKHHPDRAAKVVEIALHVQAVSSGEEFNTVEALIAFVTLKVDFDRLEPEDELLARALIATISQELTKRIGVGKLTGPNILVVNQVAGWIVEAAQATTSQPRLDAINTRAQAIGVR